MRIGIISDLHVDRRHARYSISDFEHLLADEVHRRKIELLLIAGDISSDYRITTNFIHSLMARTGIDIRFVPGNHDYWQPESEDTSSADIYRFYREHPESMIGAPLILDDDWAIVGHSGWYDYSYADARFSTEKIASGKFYGGTWQDKVRTSWPMDDPALSKAFADAVRQDLEEVGDRNIIMMTHVVTHRNFAVPTPHRLFDFYNAFIGTSDFDTFYKEFPIRYSIMGHVHFRHQFTDQGIHYICPCLGYSREWRTDDLAVEIGNTLQVIDI
ncbi:metallophosphoesterase [Salinicoccus roseus]|uniref:Metallophosphoesterase n=1 Tax=Salinicoccus roseus TaxID=45670 RepID=A0A0C2HFH7_9STAP|nr:metallophosphoesterase [Salinicoccus roseus]KIH70394.1 phosphohydrolase [Salinicoccus roseus]MDB0580941.1 metallophosphoesterase [Salinicoccus roseus]